MGQEVSVLPSGFREALENVFLDWQARLSVCFDAAVAARELPARTDCSELAAYFWIGWEGAVLRARLVQNAQPLDTFIIGFLRGLPR
jgi:TetR/AcrR family transcriptional repressor of nem operon